MIAIYESIYGIQYPMTNDHLRGVKLAYKKTVPLSRKHRALSKLTISSVSVRSVWIGGELIRILKMHDKNRKSWHIKETLLV